MSDPTQGKSPSDPQPNVTLEFMRDTPESEPNDGWSAPPPLPVSPAPSGEWQRTCWVVERFENGKSAGYWDGGSSRTFISDIEQAIQFCRRQDAMWVAAGWHWKDIQITEHIMLSASPSPPQKNLENRE